MTPSPARRAAIGTVLIFSLLLGGCLARPQPGVLQSMGETVEGAEVVNILAMTTRGREAPNANVFTTERVPSPNLSAFTISVPPSHEPGRIEWPERSIDPATTFATLDQGILTTRGFYEAAANPENGGRDVTVFVHGYNTSFVEALYRFAQMRADTGQDGSAVLFAWPSEEAVAGYVADREAVTYSRDALAQMLAELAHDRRIGSINLIAHSMGGWLTMEALRQLRLTGQGDVLDRLSVILAAPDIDVDVFESQLRVLGPMDPPLTVLVSTDDRALLVSNRLGGARDRVGALDINDARVQELAARDSVAIIDISSVQSADGLNHSRFAQLAALYPQGSEGEDGDAGFQIRQAGAFVFNAAGRTIASPFDLIGQILDPQQ
jgi:esterase/lipase superfamily enzyme